MTRIDNEESREYVYDVCPKCLNDAWILVIKLREPETVNPGSEYEWVRTEIRSKCGSCYL